MTDYMTAEDAAKLWNVSTFWVRKLCRDKRVAAKKYGRDWLIPKGTPKPVQQKRGPKKKASNA